jgi:hypothetical protein
VAGHRRAEDGVVEAPRHEVAHVALLEAVRGLEPNDAPRAVPDDEDVLADIGAERIEGDPADCEAGRRGAHAGGGGAGEGERAPAAPGVWRRDVHEGEERREERVVEEEHELRWRGGGEAVMMTVMVR